MECQGDPILLVRDSFKRYIEANRWCETMMLCMIRCSLSVLKAVLQHLTELQRFGSSKPTARIAGLQSFSGL